MAPNVVLVTGVADHLGGRLAARLAADPGIERVLGVAPASPAAGLPARVEVVAEGDPGLFGILRGAKVDTVVHAAPGGHRRDALVTARLLGACRRSGAVRKLVVRSTAEIYGASATAPAVFTEQDAPVPGPAGRETQVATFAGRRPDVTVTTIRLAELIAPGVDSALARYFAGPVVPTVLGFDARVQLLHHRDAVAVLARAATHDRPGVFNAGGDGVLLLSQAVRRAGRVPLPVPRAAVPAAARLARAELTPGLARLLSYGRVVDTTSLKTAFGYTPRWSTPAAFDDYVRGPRPAPRR